MKTNEKQTVTFKKELKVALSFTLPFSIAYQVGELVEKSGTTKSQVLQDLVIKGLSNA
jgi:hypothetical protein